MKAPPPLEYPVFAIFHPETGNFGNVSAMSPDNAQSRAVAVWTWRAMAQKFIADVGIPGDLVELRNPQRFRRFIEQFQGRATGVALDPIVEANGHVALRWIGTIGDVLQSLPEPEFVWSYPVFVVNFGNDDFGAMNGIGEDRGVSRGMPVFTDEDLAERFLKLARRQGHVEPLNDAHALANLVRRQNVRTLAFDMQSGAKGTRCRHGVDVVELFDGFSDSLDP